MLPPLEEFIVMRPRSLAKLGSRTNKFRIELGYISYLFLGDSILHCRGGVQCKLQLISRSSGLIVSEFYEGFSCVQREKFYLSNKDLVDVELNVTELGKLSWSIFRPNLLGGEYILQVGRIRLETSVPF
ncbi:MAG TPA: hypothetical protein PK129_06510 [Cellvibrionaceae bacterium]|nr:hypothetical protein [Cellvibrionaceae bacterium]